MKSFTSQRPNIFVCACRPLQRSAARAVPRQKELRPSALGQDTLDSRRNVVALALVASFTLGSGWRRAHALGLEALPQATAEPSEALVKLREKKQQVDEAANAAFENSDLMRGLRDRTEANRVSNRKALQDKYCRRQAELGVGDCGGLRYIPGATRSGKQKTPEWLKGLLSKLGQGGDEEVQEAAAAIRE